MSELLIYQLFAEIARQQQAEEPCLQINTLYVGLLADLQAGNLERNAQKYGDKLFYFNRKMEQTKSTGFWLPIMVITPDRVRHENLVFENGMFRTYSRLRCDIAVLDNLKSECCENSTYCISRTPEQVVSDTSALLKRMISGFLETNSQDIEQAMYDGTELPTRYTINAFSELFDYSFTFANLKLGGVFARGVEIGFEQCWSNPPGVLGAEKTEIINQVGCC